jgi:hypothetical protein
MNNGKPRWIDATINLQTLVTGIVCGGLTGGLTLVIIYFTLVQRVSRLEDHVAYSDKATADQRADTKESLRDISTSVKETNAKVDVLTSRLIPAWPSEKIPHRD